MTNYRVTHVVRGATYVYRTDPCEPWAESVAADLATDNSETEASGR